MKKIIPALLLLSVFYSYVSADILQYVAKEDPSYKWEKTGEEAIPPDATKISIKLTSQTWEGILLTHRINIIKPKIAGTS